MAPGAVSAHLGTPCTRSAPPLGDWGSETPTFITPPCPVGGIPPWSLGRQLCPSGEEAATGTVPQGSTSPVTEEGWPVSLRFPPTLKSCTSIIPGIRTSPSTQPPRHILPPARRVSGPPENPTPAAFKGAGLSSIQGQGRGPGSSWYMLQTFSQKLASRG